MIKKVKNTLSALTLTKSGLIVNFEYFFTEIVLELPELKKDK